MAVTVQEIAEALSDRFQLRLVAGADALSHVVTWVHMLEDTSVAQFFWGNEMVVTGGYAMEHPGQILSSLQTLVNMRCAGVIINIGPYIQELPLVVIDWCNRNGLPLFTMPWSMSMTEFVRAACTCITQSSRQEEELTEAVLAAVRNPDDPGRYQGRLSEYFDAALGLRLLAVHMEFARDEAAQQAINDQRSILRLHTALQDIPGASLIFRYDQRLMILLNNASEEVARRAAESIRTRIRQRFQEIPMQIGIGDHVEQFSALSDAFHSALSAQRCALLQGQEIVAFSQMGFYRLLYSVPDDALLQQYYDDQLTPLLEYDRAHNAALTETLFRYLLADGSLSAVAAEMFTHRNTINYRMGKIRELLGCPLETTGERLPYLLAYHIGVILKRNPAVQ